jgi:hypothetical protein
MMEWWIVKDVEGTCHTVRPQWRDGGKPRKPQDWRQARRAVLPPDSAAAFAVEYATRVILVDLGDSDLVSFNLYT